MRNVKANFKRITSLILTVILVVSTLVVAVVPASATTVSNDENIFNDLIVKETELFEFQSNGAEISGSASAGNGAKIPGVASALNVLNANNDNRLYQRCFVSKDVSTLAMKWASPITQKSGIMLGKSGTNVGSGVGQAYVLEDNTTYEISYDYYNKNGIDLSLEVLGVSHASNIVLQDLEDEHTYTSLNSNKIDETAASKKWTTYSCTFTTGTLGSDKYLSFAIFRESTDAFEFWLDNFKVSKVVKVDTADVITFNDNGKVYYAYPENLTALPEGENGPLSSQFMGWVDANGMSVTDIPAAGTTVYAKYPVSTDIPEKVDSLYLALTNSSEQNNISENAAKGILGVVSASNSDHRIYSRTATIADGSSAIVVKFADKWTSSRTITLGKANVVANGTANALAVEPNTEYVVSYYIKHDSGAGVKFELLASEATNSTSGYVLDSYAPETVKKTWEKYTCTFTTPDAETLGANTLMQFAITVPEGEAIDNVAWLYGVTISKRSEATDADVIKFVDNDKTYYAFPENLTALPVGDGNAYGSDFACWVDADGVTVSDVPAAGTVLYAKYPTFTEMPEKVDSLYLALTNTSEQNNIALNDAKGILGVVSSSSSNHKIYSRTATIADGSSAIVIKFVKDWTSSRTITLGKANVVGNATAKALVVEPNAEYKISYFIKHTSGAGVKFEILASEATSSTSGYVLDSYAPETADNTWVEYTCTFTTPDAATLGANTLMQFAITVPEGESIANEVWLYGFNIVKTTKGASADYITFVDGENTFYGDPAMLNKLPEGKNAAEGEDFLGWYDANGEVVSEIPAAGTVLTAKYGIVKTGIIMASIRYESGKDDTYVSAGIRFRGRIDKEIADKSSEIGFIMVPSGYDVDSSYAIKGANKSTEQGTDVIYDDSMYGFVDYQIILTGLTRENSEKNLCDTVLDVYFYYVVDGVRNFCGKSVSYSHNDIIALRDASYPVINNTLNNISQAATGEAATDKITGETLTLTPPELVTANGSASYVDATDGTTLMTVTNTGVDEYKAYLNKLDELGYTAIVGDSRVLSASQNFSAIYSDGTNLINAVYTAFDNTVKVTIEPLGFDNVDDVNNYLAMFHDASSIKPENAVCDPLFLTVGLSSSENNGDDGYGFYHGLGYIYRLSDGSFVIIDGGSDDEIYDHAGKIYAMLKYYAPNPEDIVISAWIMTHAHSDHIYAFKSFAPKYLADESYNVTLKNIIANLPNENWIADGGMAETVLAPFRTLFAECKTRGTNVYKAHVGQVYNLPGFTTEILYTTEATAPVVLNKSMSNTTSLIFRTVVEGKSFLYTADATSTSIAYVNDAFGRKMKSDFVQVPHHGTLSNFAVATRPELEEFYTINTAPSYALWPSAEAGMNIYLSKDTSENINAVLGEMLTYDKMIALGSNIEEIKLNADDIEIKTLQYYEIGYLKEAPVAITTEEEFKAISDNPRGYYYLANNIVITEEVTAPYWANNFAGYLDGKGFSITFSNGLALDCAGTNRGILCNNVQGVIRNINFGTAEAPLKIAYSESASGAMGLFGSVLADIVFDNVKVYADIEHTANNSYGNYVGGFIGRIYKSTGKAAIATFKNCSFIGSYTENKVGSLKAFGGFVGGMTDHGRLNVSGCAVTAVVTGKSTNAASGVGGVIGRINKAYTVYIDNTTVIGSVTGGKYVGSIAGNVDSTSGIVVISNCTGTAADNICGNAGTVTTIK